MTRGRTYRRGPMIAALACMMWAAGWTRAADGPFFAGADISMLPTIEKAGGVYRRAGQAGDAVQILHDAGCNLYRIRLFVDPTSDYRKSFGAVQNLPYVIALAKRVKAVGAVFLLDIHYSDTWADPQHQVTPAAWKDLDPVAMQQKVYTYTKSVLQECQASGVMPDMVQVGNEITEGMLWPTGRVDLEGGATAAGDAGAGVTVGSSDEQQWQRFAGLFNAGAKAVREAQSGDHKIRIVLHISRGGYEGVPMRFFDRISRYSVDYDVMGLSFYPAWGDSMPLLQKNMAELAQTYHKDILIAEVSYSWSPLSGVRERAMTWPQTPQGQAQFLKELTAAIRAVPGGHGLGYVWWYPEAVRVPGMFIWRGGDEALFDGNGDLLPAADLLKDMSGAAAR